MNQTKGDEGTGTTQTGKYLDDLRKGLKRYLRDPKFFVEVLALVGLALYTCETRRTNNLTQKTITQSDTQFTKAQAASARQFVTDQRPYVWLTNVPPPTFRANEIPKWDFRYSNFGRSPAVNLRMCVDALLSLNKGPSNAVLRPWMTLPYLNLKTFEELPAPSVERCKDRLRVAPVLGPGEVRPFWIDGPFPTLTAKEIEEIKGKEGGLVVWGMFEYTDDAKAVYDSTFCVYLARNNFVAYCPRYNDI